MKNWIKLKLILFILHFKSISNFSIISPLSQLSYQSTLCYKVCHPTNLESNANRYNQLINTNNLPVEIQVERANMSSSYNCQTYHDIYTSSINCVGWSEININKISINPRNFLKRFPLTMMISVRLVIYISLYTKITIINHFGWYQL